MRIVKPLHSRAKRSELWVSSEDLKRTRSEFHGILDCLTLDSSLYHEGGYFLLGLDSKQEQKQKYRNMLDSRYAVLKEQRQQNDKAEQEVKRISLEVYGENRMPKLLE